MTPGPRYRFEYESNGNENAPTRHWYVFHDDVPVRMEAFCIGDVERFVEAGSEVWIGLKLIMITSADRVTLCPYAPLYGSTPADIAWVLAKDRSTYASLSTGKIWLHFPGDSAG